MALYLVPLQGLDDWMKTDPAVRKPAEDKMRGEWQQWMQKHGKSIVDTAGAGKTKRVNSGGVADARNEVMLYSVVQADSHEQAARMFEGHPHLQIPNASIEVMEINPLGGT